MNQIESNLSNFKMEIKIETNSLIDAGPSYQKENM